MTVKTLKLISRFAIVLIILSIIPSGAFASENAILTNLTDLIYDPGSCPSCPAGNISEENFTEVQADMKSTETTPSQKLLSMYQVKSTINPQLNVKSTS